MEALSEIYRCLTPNGTYALLSNSPKSSRELLWSFDWKIREVIVSKLPMRYVEKDKDPDYPKKYVFYFCEKGVQPEYTEKPKIVEKKKKVK